MSKDGRGHWKNQLLDISQFFDPDFGRSISVYKLCKAYIDYRHPICTRCKEALVVDDVVVFHDYYYYHLECYKSMFIDVPDEEGDYET